MLTSEQILDAVQDVADGIEGVYNKGTYITLGNEAQAAVIINDPAQLQEKLNQSFQTVVNSLNSHYAEGWQFIDWQETITTEGNPRYIQHDDSGVICVVTHQNAGGLHRLQIVWKVQGERL